MKGKLIAFEGVDGSGTTTQSLLLTKFLKNLGIPTVHVREPGGTELGSKIRDLLLNAENEVVPIAELFLFMASRAQLVWNVIEPALYEGKFVICDRFTASSMAYQGYGRGLPRLFIDNCNEQATAGTSPDATVYLLPDLEITWQRLRHSKVPMDRMEQEGREFQAKVHNGYMNLAKDDPNARIFTDNFSIEDTHQEIKESLLGIISDWREVNG